MLDAIKSAQLAMNEDNIRMQMITDNISNMHTPAFQANFADFLTDNTLTENHQQSIGKLIETKHPTDFALNGKGYVRVLTDEGEYYTRRLDCHLSEKGELVTAFGAKVLGQSGPILLENTDFKVDDIKIPVYQFDPEASLHYLGQGLYQTTAAATPTEDTKLQQGFIETSNVKAIDEMSAMLSTVRHLDAESQVMKTMNRILNHAINTLGETNV